MKRIYLRYGLIAFVTSAALVNSAFAQTWTPTAAIATNWATVACSATGTKLVAAVGGFTGLGLIYTSLDSGATWTEVSGQYFLYPYSWTSVASSADGNRLMAVVGGYPSNLGLIYTSQSTPTPNLSITSVGTATLVAWTIPSVNFTLQQNSDLTTTNWTDVVTAPTVTNQQNQVVLPAPTGNAFYRLKSQ